MYPTAVLQSYNEAIALSPRWASPHANLGFVLRDMGDIDAAIQSYETAADLDPKDAISCYNLGVLFFNHGRLEDAANRLRQAVGAKPDYPSAWNNLGVVLRKLGDLDGAVAAYETAAKLQPGNAKVHHNLGIVQEQRQDLNAAAEVSLSDGSPLAASKPADATGRRIAQWRSSAPRTLPHTTTWARCFLSVATPRGPSEASATQQGALLNLHSSNRCT